MKYHRITTGKFIDNPVLLLIKLIFHRMCVIMSGKIGKVETLKWIPNF